MICFLPLVGAGLNTSQNVHFAVLWSSPQRPLFDNWLSSLADAMMSDEVSPAPRELYNYNILAEFFPQGSDVSGDGRFGDGQWRVAVERKVAMLANVVASVPEGDLVVLSDVDLEFFNNSLGRVLGFHKEAGNAVTFMAEPRMGVNTGFVLLTVSNQTRRFVRTWAASVSRNDQVALNNWLKRSPRHRPHFGFGPLDNNVEEQMGEGVADKETDEAAAAEGPRDEQGGASGIACSAPLQEEDSGEARQQGRCLPPIGDLPKRMGVFPPSLVCNRQENLYYDSALYHVIGFRHGGIAMKVSQLGKVAGRMVGWQKEIAARRKKRAVR
jgi:hypothetical protein